MNIDELKKANFLLKKIRQYQQKIAEFEMKRDSFIEEYTARIEDAKKNCELDCAASVSAIAELKTKLQEIALNNLDEGQRSIRLPEGQLRFVASPVEFYFDNGEKPEKKSSRLIDYLLRYDDTFIVKNYSADWAKFKKSLKFDLETGEVFNPDGERIPGFSCLRKADKFQIHLTDEISADEIEKGQNDDGN